MVIYISQMIWRNEEERSTKRERSLAPCRRPCQFIVRVDWGEVNAETENRIPVKGET